MDGLNQLDDFKQIADIVEKKYQRQSDQNYDDTPSSSQPQISSKFKKSMNKMLKDRPGPQEGRSMKKRDQKNFKNNKSSFKK